MQCSKTKTMVSRSQIDYAKSRLFKGKALLVFGPRQVGKTTFVQNLIADLNKKTLSLNGDESDVLVLFENPNVTKLKSIIGDNEILVIDEAQRIANIGIVLKIIVDLHARTSASYWSCKPGELGCPF